MAIDRDAAVHARLYLRAIAEANRGHDGRRTETIGKSTPRRFNDPDDVVHRPDRKVELTIEVERGGEQRRHNGHCVVAHCDYADCTYPSATKTCTPHPPNHSSSSCAHASIPTTALAQHIPEIGRASSRERVCQYV